jgi:Spy/CpxP family protein refolding chaperone
MRNAFVGALLVVLAALAAACSGKFNVNAPTGGPGGGTSREALWEKDLTLKEEAIVAFGDIRDQQSLNLGRQKLATLMERHKEYKQEYQKLGPPNAQEAETIRRKFEARAKAAREGLAKEMNRVNQLPGGGDAYRMGVELMTDLK